MSKPVALGLLCFCHSLLYWAQGSSNHTHSISSRQSVVSVSPALCLDPSQNEFNKLGNSRGTIPPI